MIHVCQRILDEFKESQKFSISYQSNDSLSIKFSCTIKESANLNNFR